jgi:23S rRNA pseudouridine1911/1915/1917 synthase
MVTESEELDDIGVKLNGGPSRCSGTARERLDRALRKVPEFACSYLQQLIELGLVSVNARMVKRPRPQSRQVTFWLSSYVPPPKSGIHAAVDGTGRRSKMRTFWSSTKPAGQWYPAPGNWSGIANGLLAYDPAMAMCPEAGIVHRLDKDTSGLMVVARTRAAWTSLVKAIAARDVSRQYLACAHHPWRGAARRTVDAPIGRDPRNRLRMAVVDLAVHPGKTAKTDFVLLENGLDGCLVRCILHTGRTHQIRVHMASLGHPLVADQVYGGGIHATMSRQALHAVHLSFVHPHTLEQKAFDAPLPADFKALLHAWGLRYNPPTRVVNP